MNAWNPKKTRFEIITATAQLLSIIAMAVALVVLAVL